MKLEEIMLNLKKLIKIYVLEHEECIGNVITGKYLSFKDALEREMDCVTAYQGIRKLYLRVM
jgi:hypothetical protein